MLKPIILNEINVPLWLRLLPFQRGSYIKKQIDKTLISRCEQEVEDAWGNVGISYGRITDILNIIAKNCGWKSIKFIPSDELSCVLMCHDLDLGDVAAFMDIEESYPDFNIEKYLHFDSDLLCFIRFVLGGNKLNGFGTIP